MLKDDLSRVLEKDVVVDRYVKSACGPSYLASKSEMGSVCRCRRSSTQCECDCGGLGVSKVY